MKIMVPVDSSQFSDRAVEIAGQYSEKFPGEIFLINVQPDIGHKNVPMSKVPLPYLDEKFLVEDGNAILDEAEKILTGLKVEKVTRKILFGTVSEEIINFAQDNAVDLIIIGSQGLTGIKRFLIGSVANTVVAHAHCSVLVVKSVRK